MAVRFLHTADWQLGRGFAGLPPEVAGVVREARFEAVRRIARLAVERRADAVLVAGDAFDDNLVGAATCARALAAMRTFPGLWVMLPGNHDADSAASVWSRLRAAGLPDNVLVAGEPAPLLLCDGAVAILPAPLRARRIPDDLSAWMDAAATPAGSLRIGLAHGSVQGLLPGEADASNPIAGDRAARARLDYLALGDWHGTLQVDPRTWYSGTPEPDRFTANEPGHVLLVEIAGVGATPLVERFATASHVWRTAELDCTGLAAEDATAALEGLLPPPERRHGTLLRLRLRGAVGLACRMALDRAAERLGGELCWLDLVTDGLVAEPDGQDLRALAGNPATAAAAAALQELAASGPEAERDLARHALRLLYAEAAAAERAA